MYITKRTKYIYTYIYISKLGLMESNEVERFNFWQWDIQSSGHRSKVGHRNVWWSRGGQEQDAWTAWSCD